MFLQAHRAAAGAPLLRSLLAGFLSAIGIAAADAEHSSPDSAKPGYIATFSIVARDPATGDLGVAVQSKYFSVGAVVPHARAGIGALATQARGNILYGAEGLDLLADGKSPADALQLLLADDPQREERQVGIVDAQGRAATFTGSKTIAWAGGRTGENYAVQGNLLAGPEVLDAMAAAFETGHGDFASRLVTALAAGQAAGGDARGRQSAAVLVVRTGSGYMGANDRYVELHVEDHPAPIRELRRLLGIRLAQLAVEECTKTLAAAVALPEGSEREAMIGQGLQQAEELVRLDPRSDAAWLCLAEASLAAGDQSRAAAAGQRAVILNPMLKRYSGQPDSGLGPDPEVLEDLLAIDSFRQLWEALPDAKRENAR